MSVICLIKEHLFTIKAVFLTASIGSINHKVRRCTFTVVNIKLFIIKG